MHVWLKLERVRVPDCGSIAGTIDYSLNSCVSLARHLDDGAMPIDNNSFERQSKPWGTGKKGMAPFAAASRPGSKLKAHDPRAYLLNVLSRLPSHPNGHIDELLPYRGQKPTA